MRLHAYWAAQGCVLWQPYNIQVGAGTANPATTLRVLGPEPWRVAYVEPSVRPDDGRYGENPNRMQYFYQYQVILKPDPGNPLELYLASLAALGLNPREHDVRFVEDNWESPALGAWGLGWEVWLDGQEITQYTYFQQAGGLDLEPVSVEITYGLERIVLALQGKDSVWDVNWLDGSTLTYGDIYRRSEWEHSTYYFKVADIEELSREFDFFEAESQRALEADLILPAYDYSLKCSHTFNILDARGAVGVTERAQYFRRMAALTHAIAKAYVAQRQQMGYPLSNTPPQSWLAPATRPLAPMPPPPAAPADVLIEIGTEELPAGDLDDALRQLEELAPALFDALRLDRGEISVMGTPRRLVLHARDVAPRQRDVEQLVKGPPVSRAFDAEGKPTAAALGFARGKGVDVSALEPREMDGGRYVVAVVREPGRPATEALAERLPGLIAALRFGKAMRWNASGVAFSRPIRWLLALFGGEVIPFAYAGVVSGNTTRGLRAFDPDALRPRELPVKDAAGYFRTLADEGIVLNHKQRFETIRVEVRRLAAEVGGRVIPDPSLLAEVTNLVERPTLLCGHFDEKYLALPDAVLIAVMKKHQRYFPVMHRKEDRLLPYFIAVRNGDDAHLDKVRAGNEHVILARFADADYFFREDRKHRLEDFLPRLATKTFQEQLGSYLDKSRRVTRLVAQVGPMLNLSAEDQRTAERAAYLSKADQATQMVTEMTSLEGVMGGIYARLSGEPEAVAQAIAEGYLPRSAGDALPRSPAGVALAIADRLDSLAGLFAVGLAPTASADPFGLRRAALGLVQIVLEHKIDLDLRAALKKAAAVQPVEVSEAVRAQIIEFVKGRLYVLLREQGNRHDVVEAVLVEQGHNPYRAAMGARELAEAMGGMGDELPEQAVREKWLHTLDTYARCVRITRGHKRYDLDPAAFVEPIERALFDAYQEAAAKLSADDNAGAFLEAFAPMVPVIERFFAPAAEGGVMVMHEDERIRRNRLALLQCIGELARGRADLSKLEGF